MKIYYNGNYKFIDSEGIETIYYDLEDVPNYRYKVTEIEVEDGTTKIKEDAFKSCYSLESIKLPDSLKEIDPYAFTYCESLKKIEIPNNVTKIKQHTFNGCLYLKEIKLPKNLIKIEDYAFGNCKSLTRIIIPENTKNISSFVFYMCLGLNEVVFENNPDFKINYNAFTCCESLNSQTKEKLFYQIAKNVEKYDIKSFFEMYDKKYDSELVQELITMNINFFDYANNTDREVFLDAALDSIKNITKTSDGYDIETELCNINIKNHKYYLYLPEKENVLVRIINDKSGIKIFNAVSYYFYKEEKNKNGIINKMLEKDKEISK